MQKDEEPDHSIAIQTLHYKDGVPNHYRRTRKVYLYRIDSMGQ
jgi:hypothetical protein